MLAWSGVLAVIATNLVIAAYVVMAWNEEDNDDKDKDKEAGKNNHKDAAGNVSAAAKKEL